MNNFYQNMNYQNRMFQQPYNPYGQSNNGINWVQGIEGAKAYQLMPSSNTILLDSENDGVFYIKVSDNVGMCSLRTFTYTEVIENNTKTETHINDLSKYVTRDELDDILNKRLRGGKDNGKQPVQSTKSTITE